MRIVVVNPNTTASMTRKIGEAARLVASPGTTIMAVNPLSGPASIEGFYDGALAVPGLLSLMADHREGSAAPGDAFVIGCFDDTGLDAARCLTDKPVIGIGEAAFHMASMLGRRFSVVTTLSRSVAGIEANLTSYGLMARCGRVRATDIPVLDLEDPRSGARGKIDAEIDAALKQDHADVIVLGCAGMADLAADLSRQFGVPVIDGVAAAVKLGEAMAGLGLKTSKRGAYAVPREK
ncbi:aspartate/glutamate racemase family protein [Lichenihabitans sp. PAMC28606]|uniref:aspartate/glutamate racemase family protein n=1 Tax=Lichenihabitans sp. PAMC28606 TaxID=2880932 RepID=UPI001D0AA017|nr:aspartate/glutamate racemase family protein [Lichenihabitans sp. PAMC28606]UDL93267.1 aspartate/glutamate racemase family protein [Lichenihabitans sp. PAMC28606]